MSRLFTTSTTASSGQPLQPEPSTPNSVIKTQAALHATMTRTEPQNFEIASEKNPFNGSWYAMDYIEAADAQELLSVAGNFSDGQSFEADLFVSGNASEEAAGWATYKIRDRHELQEHVEVMRSASPRVTTAKTAVFFIYLSPGVRYGNSKLSIDAPSTEYLLSVLKVSAAAVADVFGRPDYWSPGHFVDSGVTEFWCQHPRWDIHNREQPISMYMRYDSEGDSTTYLVSGGKDDYIINQLQEFLRSRIKEGSRTPSLVIFIDPFEIHYLIARLSFEFSKGFVSGLRRTLYDQLDKIDRHTQSINIAGEREELKKRTTALSLLSQNVDSFIAGFHMALGIASKLKHAHEEFFSSVVEKSPTSACILGSQRLTYSIRWLNSSFETQLRWLHSYKARKDTSMTLVYNLVTQQDSSIMIQDSSSMKGIAILTMLFLPGAFTSSLLSCGILSATNHGKVDTTGLWWFWLALTIPLTIVVLGFFLVWYRMKQNGLDWKDVFRLRRSMNSQTDAENGFEKKRA